MEVAMEGKMKIRGLQASLWIPGDVCKNHVSTPPEAQWAAVLVDSGSKP